MSSIFPFILLAIFNCLIARAVRRSKRDSQLRNEHLRRTQLKSQDQQLITMLLLVTVTFLVTTLPQTIRVAVYSIFINPWSSPKMYANYVFFIHLTSKVYWSNAMANFFLYCISGSKFRNDLKGIFACGRRIRKWFSLLYFSCITYVEGYRFLWIMPYVEKQPKIDILTWLCLLFTFHAIIPQLCQYNIYWLCYMGRFCWG
jgi:hypothetical protein